MSWTNEIADVDQLKKTFEGLDASLNKNATDLLNLIKVYENLNKAMQGGAITSENLGKAQKATADAAKQKETIDKQIITTTEKVNKVEKDTIDVLIKRRLTTAETTKEITLQTKVELAAVGSKQKLIAETALLENQLNKVNLTTKEGAKEAERLRAQIDANNKTIKENSSQLGAQKINIGNYKSAFTGLIDQFKAGEIGAGGLIKGILSIGKAFIVAIVTNPVLLTIAAITGAVYALWKAFSKSDEFMNVVSGGFKALSNVLDVLSDRLMSFFKMMGSIFTLDWKGMRENGKAAFDGIGQSIKDAALAGYNYIQVMDDIDDREAASLVRAAKLRAEIEELKNISKDQTKTSRERSEAAQRAYDKEIELFKLEKQFAGEKTDAEKNNLASKIQNNALSLKDKQDQLTKWLQFDDTEINSAQEKDAAFKEFYDKNEAEFKKVQKMMADEIMQRAGFNQETRRLLTSLSGFKKELIDEEEKKRVEQFDLGNKKEIEKINAKHLAGITSEEEYQKELLDNDVIYLNKKLTLYKKDSKEYEDILLLIQDKEIKSQDDILKAIQDRLKQQKEIEQQGSKDLEDLLKDQRSAEEKAADDAIKTGEKLNEDKKKLDDDYVKSKKEKDKDIRDAAIDLARDSINAVFEMQNMQLEKELSDLDKKKEKELSNKNLTEAQKLKIEADYDKKAGAIKTKQAQQAKIQALFDIAIGTAVSVMNAKGNLPLMIILAAMGAVQAALVAARPIPKYAKGTKSAEREGIFGEAGIEVMFPKGGGAIFADKPTYFHGNEFQGAKIYSNEETKKMIKQMDHHSVGGRQMTDDRILAGLKSVETAIQNKKEWIMDNDYRVIGHKVSNHQEIILNRLLRN